MTPPAWLSPEHRLRLHHVFSCATPLRPDQEFQWLGRAPGVPSSAALGPGWITEPLAALDYLSGFWSSLSEHPDRICHLDDMWAAARHHAFRDAHLLSHGQLDSPAAVAAETAREAWVGLPMTLRFAAESAARGRSRPSMIRDLFRQLSTAERGIAPTLAAHGYGPGRVVNDTGPASPDGKEN